jgi:hypothetical protein
MLWEVPKEIEVSIEINAIRVRAAGNGICRIAVLAPAAVGSLIPCYTIRV